MDADTKWGEVFDALTTSEQECIRDTLLDDILEWELDQSVLSESDTVEGWEILIFSCLAPQTARAVFLDSIIAEIGEDEVFVLDADMVVCLGEWVAELDVFATMLDLWVDNPEIVEWPFKTLVAAMVALSVDDPETAGKTTTALLTCTQDLVVALMLEETGLTLEDLSEEEATCLRAWVTETDWTTLLTGSADDPSALFGFLPDLMACAPDMFISSMLEETGLTLEDLSEEEATCLRAWVTETDWTTLLTGSADDPSALFGFLPDLMACAPDMFISSMLEETGLTLEDLSEEEATCLRAWVTETDWTTLLTGSADDPSALMEFFAGLLDCVPESWPEPGDRPWDEVVEEATPVEIGVATQGAVDYENDNDFFAFQAEDGQLYELDVTLGTLEDSVLEIYDADGTWLDGNDDYGNSTASRLIWNAPNTGTYYIQVTSFHAGTGTYTLTLTISSPDVVDDDPNSQPGNATRVEIGVTTQGAVDYDYDVDFFAFEATEGELYQLDVTLGTLQNSVLDLFDADGTWLGVSDDYGGFTASRLRWHAPSTGTYYIRATGTGTGTYTFTISISDIVDDHPNSTANATPVEIGVTTQGALDYAGDVDFFAFEATEGELYQLDVTLGTLQNSIAVIFDTRGTWLDITDDDSTASRLIWHAPTTGTYYIRVTSPYAGTGTYTLTIASRRL